jgi:hypothetical protein
MPLRLLLLRVLLRVVGVDTIDDVERWIKTRCQAKRCWDTAVTVCIDCHVQLCSKHVRYYDTLPYCPRCYDYIDNTEFIEVGR